MRKKITLVLLFISIFVLIILAPTVLLQINTLKDSLKPTPAMQIDPNSPFSGGNQLNSIPTVPKSYLRYKVIGANNVTFLIDYKFENSYYDYADSVEMGNKTSGDLYLEPPPVRSKVKISITAMSDKGKMSAPLTITNAEWWDKVSKTKNDYAMQHWFIILF